MTNPGVVYEYWRARIPRDLTPFADPGTDLRVEGEGRSLRVQWTSRGVERQAQFSISPEKVTVSFLNKTYGYSSFLVCPEMADLLGLAKMILQSQRPQLFIPTKACLVDIGDCPDQPAVELLTSVLQKESGTATRIVIVTGEAGAGKTRVLQELVRRQATAYIEGQSNTLYLYVNAQGRALARLTEALATELQDLRAVLTYHSVAALVRIGALVLIIDGFDELIGVSGYDDAFSSLARFIEELDGEGQIIASARSTYYEEEFVSRTSVASSLGGQFWTQVPVRVKAWGDEEFNSYVRERVRSSLTPVNEDEVLSHLTRVFSGLNSRLRQKPLFVARAIDLVLGGVTLEGGDDLLNELVDAYLERERKEKLLDKNEMPLLTKDQLALLLATLAEEMWNQETRELDRRSVRDLAEYVLVLNDVNPSTQAIVIERMPTLAFLARGESVGSITYEHELFFSVFLARMICRSLIGESSGMRIMLGRSVLPPEISHYVVTQPDIKPALDDRLAIEEMVVKVSEAGAGESQRIEQVRENGGKLVSALTQAFCRNNGPITGLVLSNLVFAGGDLNGVHLVDAQLDSVTFRRTDLADARIITSQGRNVYLHDVIIDPSLTRLEIRGLAPEAHVFGLRVRDGNTLRPLYDPDDVQHALEDVGAIARADAPIPRRIVPESRLKLIERLVRAYNRANPLCTADDNLRIIFADPEWSDIQRLLVSSGVATLEYRATGGRPKDFLRRQVLPEELMAGARRDAVVPTQVRRFWDMIERL